MSQTIRAAKRALRRAVRRRILALDPEARRGEEAALLRRIPSLPGYDRAATVLLYATAFREEIETRPLLEDVLRRGRRLVLPRVDRSANRLALHHVTELERDLVPGVLEIPEPASACPLVDPREIDWALVPGLAFDRRGYRLGRGAGHYDRLLPRLRRSVPRWAAALSPQWIDALPIEPHDQRLDGIAGAERTYVNSRESPGFSEDFD